MSVGEERAKGERAEQLVNFLAKPRSLIRYVKDRPGHDRRYALDNTKMRKEIGWKAAITLEKGLRGTVEWYQNHRAWWEKAKGDPYRAHYERWYGARI